MIDAPPGLDAHFFEWLQDAHETHRSAHPLTFRRIQQEDAVFLSADLDAPLPPDLLAYYVHCTPFAGCTDGWALWRSVQEQLADHQPLLPIELMPSCIVAQLHPNGDYTLLNATQHPPTPLHTDLRTHLLNRVIGTTS